MMSAEVAAGASRLAVVCSWCGSVIRRLSAKDSHGMCLKCYARMLSERGPASWEAETPSKAQTVISPPQSDPDEPSSGSCPAAPVQEEL
jgi:hypothetical protein